MATKSKKKSGKQRLKVDGLRLKAKALTTKEAKKVKGGYSGGVQVAVADIIGGDSSVKPQLGLQTDKPRTS